MKKSLLRFVNSITKFVISWFLAMVKSFGIRNQEQAKQRIDEPYEPSFCQSAGDASSIMNYLMVNRHQYRKSPFSMGEFSSKPCLITGGYLHFWWRWTRVDNISQSKPTSSLATALKGSRVRPSRPRFTCDDINCRSNMSSCLFRLTLR